MMSSEKDAGALFDELLEGDEKTTAQPEAKAADAPEATEVKEPEVAEVAEPKAEQPKAFDPNSLPAEAREYFASQNRALEEKFRKLEGDYRSLSGKVPGLQRELARYRQEQQQKPRPTEAKPDDSFFDSPDWKAASAEFPEFAKPIQTLFAAQEAKRKAEQEAHQQKVAALEQRLESLAPNVARAAEFTERYQAEREREGVLRNHPDFEEHVTVGYDREADEGFIGNVSPQMQEYLDTRTPKARDAAIRALISKDPADVDEAMATFKEWRDLKFPKQEGKKAEPSARLKASVTPTVKGRGAGGINPAQFESPGDYFDALQNGAA